MALGSPTLSAAKLPWTASPESTVPPQAAAPVQVETEQVVKLLFRQLRALAGPRPDLEDIVQTAVERALRSLPRFEGRSALSTWTYGLAYRTLLDHNRWHRRYSKRFQLADEEPVVEPGSVIDAQGRMEEAARARRLYAALDQLPMKKRVVVVLYELEGLTAREISEIMEVSEGTVRSRLRDSRAQLLNLLSRDPFFDAEATS